MGESPAPFVAEILHIHSFMAGVALRLRLCNCKIGVAKGAGLKKL